MQGLISSDTEDYQRALVDCSRAIPLDPAYASAYATRGSAYRLLDDYQHALEDLKRAIELKSEDAFSFFNRSRSSSCAR
jgi:tetratricopeptide (TPR) repeat protein